MSAIVKPTSIQSRPLVFITGASGGIGQALARRYLAAGWRVALVARQVDALRAWAKEPGVPPGSIDVFEADVRQEASIIAVAQRCIQSMGLPDVVIANAGISIGVDMAERADLNVLRTIFETNVIGLAATFHPFIAPMRRRGSGALVGIASVAGVRGMPGHAAYSASKAAVVAHCESLRVDLRPDGIRVVTLLPGYIDTPMTQGNPFPMPFLTPPEVFADRAFQAIARGDSRRVIPWQMGWVAAVLAVLPNALFDGVLARLGWRKKRQGQ